MPSYSQERHRASIRNLITAVISSDLMDFIVIEHLNQNFIDCLQLLNLFSIRVEYTWQLQLLTEDPSFDLNKVLDGQCGDFSKIAHYAALCNRIDILDHIKTEHQELLHSETAHGCTMVYVAACLDTYDVLDWILSHESVLLLAKTLHGDTIAHFAAKTNNRKLLSWIKENQPKLLQMTQHTPTVANYISSLWSSISLDEVLTQDHLEEHLQTTNINGLNIAHIAAFYDVDGATMDWIKINYPALLNSRTKNGASIAHIAAGVGNENLLEWIEINAPELLLSVTKDEMSIAHYAARNGHINILTWIKDNKPLIFYRIAFYEIINSDNSDNLHNIIFISNRGNIVLSWNNHIEVLHWIKEHLSGILDLHGLYSIDPPFRIESPVAHMAINQSDPIIFNELLNLNPRPRRFFEDDLRSRNRVEINQVSQLISDALDENFILIDIPNRYKTDLIESKLLRNKFILKADNAFKILLQGFYQPGNVLFHLTPDVLFTIFEYLLPSNIPLKAIPQLFAKIDARTPSQRMLDLIDKEIIRLQKQRPIEVRFIFPIRPDLGVNNEKISALKELKEMIFHHRPDSLFSLTTKIREWESDNKRIIDMKESYILYPDLQTSTRILLKALYSILDMQTSLLNQILAEQHQNTLEIIPQTRISPLNRNYFFENKLNEPDELYRPLLQADQDMEQIKVDGAARIN